MSKTRLQHTWTNMKTRCYNKNVPKYKNYGLRGIIVCDEWKNSFNCFKEWAINNGYNDNLQLDRIDVNKNYEPNNCRFVSSKINARNKTTTTLNDNIAFNIRLIKIYTSLSDLEISKIFNINRRSVNYVVNYKQWY